MMYERLLHVNHLWELKGSGLHRSCNVVGRPCDGLQINENGGKTRYVNTTFYQLNTLSSGLHSYVSGEYFM